MNEIPRELTEAIQTAYQKALNHAEEHFVDTDGITSSFTQWDDGDFRVEVYHGFDTRRCDMHHGEQIRYKQTEGEFVYANFTREFGWHTDRAFKEYTIEQWTPTSTPSTAKDC